MEHRHCHFVSETLFDLQSERICRLILTVDAENLLWCLFQFAHPIEQLSLIGMGRKPFQLLHMAFHLMVIPMEFYL